MAVDGEKSSAVAQDFVQFALDAGVLRFGEFKTKAGRMSPYFFNSGLFDDGAKIARLAGFYADRLIESGVEFDMIFGPAYKGIPLGATVPADITSSTISTRPLSGAPTRLPPSPCALASLRL